METIKKILFFIPFLFADNTLTAQSLSYDETVTYLKEKISILNYMEDNSRTTAGEYVENISKYEFSLETKDYCLFLIKETEYVKRRFSKTPSASHDFMKEYDCCKTYHVPLGEVPIGKIPNGIQFGDASNTFKIRAKHRSSDSDSWAEFDKNKSIDPKEIERLYKAFVHAKSLCPKDPFD